MPIYEYQCPDCGNIQEALVLQGGADGFAPSCGRCGGRSMTRVMSAHSAPVSFSRPKGQTCCGKEERCDTPPCSAGGGCRR